MKRLERVAKLFKAGQISNVTAEQLLGLVSHKHGISVEKLFALVRSY